MEKYFGYDISQNMLESATKIAFNCKELFCADTISKVADYSISSGIFNVILENNIIEWRNYILSILSNMNAYSLKGFSFNCLTDFVDYKNENLYYANPCYFFEFCRKNFSRKVTLLHDYDLWEWTLLVKK